MMAKEKAILDDYGVENGKSGEIGGITNLPQANYIIDICGFQVARLLLRGEENAIPGADLAALLGLDVRTLQRIIASERRQGAPILSTAKGTKGYFLPATGEAGRAEIEDFVKTNSSRARSLFAAIAPARAALKSWRE